MDDEKFAGLGEEFIERAGDDHVHIKEKCCSAQSVQVLRESGELGPAALGQAFGQIQRGNRQALNFGANPLAIVGQANKAKITLQVAPHHGVEPVDVFGAVFRAPFHADDIALARRKIWSGCHGQQQSLIALLAFFDRFLLGLGAFDLAARS